MGEGQESAAAASYINKAPFRSLAGLDAALTSLVERIELEIAQSNAISEKSAAELHDLRVRAERFLGSWGASHYPDKSSWEFP